MLGAPDDVGGAIGTDLPEGTRFVGPVAGLGPNWGPGDAPAEGDLAACVACGLCLPHCPTYRLSGEETASPRGRIAAMRAVAEGQARIDPAFLGYMDACLSCRACEDVCPSHVPFGRMMERARVQAEPLRSRRARMLRWLGLDVALPHRRLLGAARALTPVARPFLGKRVRALMPRGTRPGPRLPTVTEAEGEPRGTVALLTGCVQDQWFRHVNRASARVLSRAGWRVLAPRGQVCCGALQAHNGRLGTARELAAQNLAVLGSADHVVVNAAGCSAHMKDYGDLLGTPEARRFSSRVRDLMEFLDEHGTAATGHLPPEEGPIAYHDPCHALRAQGIRAQPRRLLDAIDGVELLEIADGGRCCGAAGIYELTQPLTADALMHQKAQAVAATGARVVASANPGCSMQLDAGLRAIGADIRVVHPVELIDAAYGASERMRRGTAG